MKNEIDLSERKTRIIEYVTGILLVITLICLAGFIIAFSIAKKKQLPNLNIAKTGMIVCIVLTLAQMIIDPIIIDRFFNYWSKKELEKFRNKKRQI